MFKITGVITDASPRRIVTLKSGKQQEMCMLRVASRLEDGDVNEVAVKVKDNHVYFDQCKGMTVEICFKNRVFAYNDSTHGVKVFGNELTAKSITVIDYDRSALLDFQKGGAI